MPFGHASNLGPTEYFTFNDDDEGEAGGLNSISAEKWLECNACTRTNTQVAWGLLSCGCCGTFCNDCLSGNTQCGWCTTHEPHGGKPSSSREIDFSSWTEVNGQARSSAHWEWPALADVANECSAELDGDIPDPCRASDMQDAARYTDGYDDAMTHLRSSQSNPNAHVDYNEVHRMMLCRGCELTLNEPGVGWRICTCWNYYCILCAERGCAACGARIGGTNGPINDTAADVSDPLAVQGVSGGSDTVDTCREGAILTPGGAWERREQLLKEFREQRIKQRSEWRRIVKTQWKEGLRPRRRRRKQAGVRIITMNVSGSGTFKHEYKYSGRYHGALCMVQEHHEKGQGCRDLESWLARHGTTYTITEGYTKNHGVGGGAAVIGSAPNAVRPAPGGSSIAEGRVCIGISDMEGDIAVGSVYGITSAPVAKQLALWKDLSVYLRTLGLPFIVGGDWQVHPREITKSGLLQVLDAQVIYPDEPTCAVTGNLLDYFIVSKTLCSGDVRARVMHGTSFKPHSPVEMIVDLKVRSCDVAALPRPKPFPIARPIGPVLPGARLKWEQWDMREMVHDRVAKFADVQTDVLRQWYAGVEAEISSAMGVFGCADETAYLGLGGENKPINQPQKGRYRHVDTNDGLIGVRMSWTTNALRMVTRYGRMLIDNWLYRKQAEASQHEVERTNAILNQLRRVGNRASALIRAPKGKTEGFEKAWHDIERGLKALAGVAIRKHRRDPVIEQWRIGIGFLELGKIEQVALELEAKWHEILTTKRKSQIKEVKQWARNAPASIAHGATKQNIGWVPISASAAKGHLGEAREQVAADSGINEWASTWQATDQDGAEEVWKALEAMEWTRKHDEIALNPIDEKCVLNAAKKFRGSTGVGSDWLKPRHLLEATAGAREALAWILNSIEANERWPEETRRVIAVAIGKKSGGCRLIGQTTTIYRVWAKIRYHDCREIMEGRICRPFLAAAPGKGAISTAFNVSWKGELAAAKGQEAGGVMVDFKSYFDHLRPAEYVGGAIEYGLPRVIIALCVHLYTGPRRMRVGTAVSREAWPRRSVLPGCTWGMMFVRFHVIGPAGDLVERLGAKLFTIEVQFLFNIMVDDASLVIWGSMDAVSMIYKWAVKELMSWVRTELNKEIAEGKVQGIVSSAKLKHKVATKLANVGVKIELHGDMLGVDCTMGGAMRRRSIQNKRVAKAVGRSKKIRWWRGIAGKSMQLVRTGARAQLAYGANVVGLNNRALHSLRKIHGAAARVTVAGTSLTAKLAVAGDDYSDADPAVLDAGGPLVSVLSHIWDVPEARAEFVSMWNAAVDIVMERGERWDAMKGPVGMALLTVLRADAQWISPFVIQLMDYEIDLMEAPPRQVAIIFQAHVRRSMDRELVAKATKDWEPNDRQGTRDKYSHGIDWDLIRRVLRDPATPIEERAAIEVVAVRGFWPESRRWLAGKTGTGSCEACHEAIGDDQHRLHGCNHLLNHLFWKRAAGNYRRPERSIIIDRESRLLNLHGWAPIVIPWEPRESTYVGNTGERRDGEAFGDGSGARQDQRELRCATWAVVHQKGEDGEQTVIKGSVGGWFPTVPRAELVAYLQHLRSSRVPSKYVGDCLSVIRGVRDGIPDKLVGSKCLHADVWRSIKSCLRDHGFGQDVHKTKAHRSRISAEFDADDPVEWWCGNKLADQQAKALCQVIAKEDKRATEKELSANKYSDVIRHIGVAAAWCFKNWPAANRGVRKRVIEEFDGKNWEMRRPPHREKIAGGMVLQGLLA